MITHETTVVERKRRNPQTGSMLIIVIVITGLFLVILMGALGLAVMQQRLDIQKVAGAQALNIAEAGVNYYRWVLYHDHEEYCNKETCIGSPDYGPYGPYAYKDSAGKNITGYYELYITPPEAYGSTIVNIRSVGWVADHPETRREIEVQCGIPSWSNYSTLCDAAIRFGEGTEVWGPIHSNSGIRFDGVAHNLISSYVPNYDDPDHSGPKEFGVHTHVYAGGNYDPNETCSDPCDNPDPPNYSGDPNNPFLAGREFPTPESISFNLLGDYASSTLQRAKENGIVIPNSGAEGYHITVTPASGIENDTLTIKTVTSITARCYANGDWQDTDGIISETSYLSTTTPPNGLVFIEDNIWIDGQIEDDRITILAMDNPETTDINVSPDIILNHDIIYTNYDGSDSLGLIADDNVSVGLYSEDDLRVDAALVARNGRIGRNYFSSGCDSTYYKRDVITVYGALSTKNRYGFAWTDGTGYDTRNLIYDSNLTFRPPPHYPTTGEYTFISWKEN